MLAVRRSLGLVAGSGRPDAGRGSVLRFAGLVGRFVLAARRELVVRLRVSLGQLLGLDWERSAASCFVRLLCSFLGVEVGVVVEGETNQQVVVGVGRRRSEAEDVDP